MSRNHPDEPEDALLIGARKTLLDPCNTFEVKPWREIMSLRNPVVVIDGKKPKTPLADPFAMFKKAVEKVELEKVEPVEPTSGTGDQPDAVVQWNSAPSGAMKSITSTLTKEFTMNDTEQSKQDLAAASAKAKIEAKQRKLDAIESKKAAALAKKEEKALAKAAKADEVAALKAKLAAEREDRKVAAAEARLEAGLDPEAEGMSGALREKVALGLYVKGANGQLRTDDSIALVLETVAVGDMVPLIMETMGLLSNPYEHLNQGQQSMNLRNRLRGAIRKETKIENTDVVISLARLTEIRDANYQPYVAPAKAVAQEAAEV